MKPIILFVAFMLFFFSFACGKEESTKVYSTPEGEVEVTRKQGDQGHEMTIKTDEGTATMKVGAQPIPEDLGVPIYPNVEQQEGGSWSMSGMGEKGEQGVSSTVLFSGDPLVKVSDFYKEKLKGSDPKIFEMNMPEGKMVNISVEQGETSTNIVLTENKEKEGTNIQITKAAK
jgi:hypothetical protein